MPEAIGWDFIVRFLNITLIDIALSGDNAIIIGMAAASLPRGHRKWMILIGGGLAIVLRIILTSVATLLMLIPFLSAAGGLVLMWVVYRLLKIDISENEEQAAEAAKEAANFKQAILLIVSADFMMSLDNVIAVAGSAHGSIFLLVVGLLISMPLLMTAGGFISMLIDKARWLVYAGAFAIAFTGCRMVFEDKIVGELLHVPGIAVVLISIAVGLAVPAAFALLNRRRLRSTD